MTILCYLKYLSKMDSPENSREEQILKEDDDQ